MATGPWRRYYLKAAEELGYDDIAIKEIKAAKKQEQVSQIMTRARKRKETKSRK